MQFNTPLAFVITATALVIGTLSHSGGTFVRVAAAQVGEPREIEVVAKRFEFVPSSIEVVQGERVRIVVRSGDGFHGFGIKAFDVSEEIARGDTVTIEFTPDVAGEFPRNRGYCIVDSDYFLKTGLSLP